MSQRVQQAVPYSVQAAEILRARILGGEYDPGQRLSEVELSNSLGISRSPLREALRTLANEGLVQIVSSRGVFVADFTPEQVLELLEVREALDVLAVRLAARRATPEQVEHLEDTLNGLSSALRAHGAEPVEWPADFHLTIYEVSGNETLRAQGLSVHTQIRLVRFRSGAAPERMEKAHEEHLALVAAIRDHDVVRAENCMREHLRNSTSHILEQLGGEDWDLDDALTL